ncbi:MAG TPA: MogA/MoaB family molybdenum cofactor biosynthesis protein [Ktedonobacterales bacterium]
MFKVGVLTISTKGAAGEREDASGDLLVASLAEHAEVVARGIVPDDKARIEQALRQWADDLRLPLILTTGGTGLSPTDVTPEATRTVISREAPGIAEAMRAASLRQTPMGMLSRGIAGVREQTLIINLPGSPKAVRECLEVVLPVLAHAVELVTGERTEH